MAASKAPMDLPTRLARATPETCEGTSTVHPLDHRFRLSKLTVMVADMSPTPRATTEDQGSSAELHLPTFKLPLCYQPIQRTRPFSRRLSVDRGLADWPGQWWATVSRLWTEIQDRFDRLARRCVGGRIIDR